MSGRHPEEVVTVPSIAQNWRAVTFIHWAIDPDVLDGHLPRGIRPDLVDGRAWIALTPMVIDHVRPLALPWPMGARPSFPETNLRTYVRTQCGAEGIWFFSLDAAGPMTVLGGRAVYRQPYHHATMRVDE